MPTKRIKRIRKVKQGLPDHLLNYFLTGDISENESEAFEIFLMLDEQKINLWNTHKEYVMEVWQGKNGNNSKPWGFYEFEQEKNT